MRIVKAFLLFSLVSILSFIAGCSKGDPKLEVSPDHLNFDSTTVQQQITIKNVGDDNGILKSGVKTLEYTLYPSGDWIVTDVKSGSCEKGESDKVNVSISRANLPPAVSEGQIDITSNGGDTTVLISILPIPSAPDLYSPQDSSMIENSDYKFVWEAVDYAHTYELIVDTFSSFLSPVIHEIDLDTNCYVPLFNLKNDNYFWKVRAKNIGGQWGDWSNVKRFTLNIPPHLSDGRVTTIEDASGTLYRYTVTFFDYDNFPPHSTDVLIDGVTHPMSKDNPQDSNFIDGVTYIYEILPATGGLSAGAHTCRFKFGSYFDSVIFYPPEAYIPAPIVSEDTSIEYAEDVIWISEQDSVQLVSVVDSIYTYTYSGTPPQIKVGDILMSTDSGGYLREVVAIDTTGSKLLGKSIRISTKLVPLIKAFKKVDFDTVLIISLDDDLLQSSREKGLTPYLAQGVSVADGLINLDSTKLFSGNIDGSDVQVLIESGSLDFQPRLELHIHLNDDIQQVLCSITGMIELEISPTISADAYLSKKAEKNILSVLIPLEGAGIPFEIVFELNGGFEINANVKGTLHYNMIGNSSVTVGGEYRDGVFSKIFDVSKTWVADSPQWNAQANASAKIYLRPEVSVKVFQTMGPYLDVAPYVKLDGEVTTDPYCWNYDVHAGLEATAGLELTPFIFEWRYEIPIFGYETLLLHQDDCPSPTPTWTKTFGGTGADVGYSVSPTSDGGYIITGSTKSFGAGQDDVYLIKTDAQGNTIWTKTFGGTDEDRGRCVSAISDEGYIVAGWTYSFGAGNRDVYLIRTDAQGNAVWTKTFGGIGGEEGWAVSLTSDGGYIVTGIIHSFDGDRDVYLLKTDAQGNAIWTKTFGGTNWDEGWAVLPTSDGEYIVAGRTLSFGAGNYDVYLIKTDAQGNAVWTKTFGGADLDAAWSVLPSDDGGYIITGLTKSFGAGEEDVYLIKTDAQGNAVWTKTFGGAYWDQGYSLLSTSEGGYIVAGRTLSFGAGNYDVYLIKTDAQGNAVWTKTFGGDDKDVGFSVSSTRDGGYIITGLTKSFGAGEEDVYLIKTDVEGNVK